MVKGKSDWADSRQLRAERLNAV